MSDHVFSFGDRVRNEGSPEWGVGTVTRVQNLVENGRSCQRLSARFERAGLKTLTTAVAKIVPAGDAPAEAAAPVASRNGAPKTARHDAEDTSHLDGRELKEIFGVLPEATRDPFVSLAERLKATIELYKYEPTGGSLLDWAAVQSRLADPLTRYSRAELEQEFQRFAYERDVQLKKLAGEARRAKDATALSLLASPPKFAAPALKRLNGAR